MNSPACLLSLHHSPHNPHPHTPRLTPCTQRTPAGQPADQPSFPGEGKGARLRPAHPPLSSGPSRGDGAPGALTWPSPKDRPIPGLEWPCWTLTPLCSLPCSFSLSGKSLLYLSLPVHSRPTAGWSPLLATATGLPSRSFLPRIHLYGRPHSGHPTLLRNGTPTLPTPSGPLHPTQTFQLSQPAVCPPSEQLAVECPGDVG